MNKNMYAFEVKRMPRGKYYVIARIGRDVVGVSRGVHDTGEEAHLEMRKQLGLDMPGNARMVFYEYPQKKKK